MAPIPLARLVLLQKHRNDEIGQIGSRLRNRASDSINRIILKTRLDSINELWAEARKTHADIEMRAESLEDPYVREKRFENMQGIFEDTLDFILTSLAKFPSDEERNARCRERENDGESDRPAKLPRLDLPIFKGKYEDWDSFADIFTTLVHNVPRIADTTKLQYLKSCLKGSAAELVKDVAILGINYASTWKALKDRFYNPRLTINKLLDSLVNMPHMKRESAVDLRAFVDEIQRIVRALTNLRAPVEHWDMWLVHTLESRLDPESRKNWEADLIARERQITVLQSDGEPDNVARFPKYVDLIAFLERRAQSLLVIQADREDKRSVHSPSINSSSRRIHHVQSPQQTMSSKCTLCAGAHFISRCPAFIAKKVYDRQYDVRHLNLCFNCLGRHKSKNCPSGYRCKVCKEKHHSMLHYKRTDGQDPGKSHVNSASKADAPAASQVKSDLTRSVTGSKLAVNNCSVIANKSQCSILLATAQVNVLGPCGTQTRVRALLDQGSEGTFISESLVQLLGLKRDRVRTNLSGVGGCEAGMVKHATSFTMKSCADTDFELEIYALVLPRLTSELPARNIIEIDLGQFENINLADPQFHISDRVDLLIGADIYGQLLRSGLKSFSDSLLVAQNTALGWIISGPTHSSSSRRAAPCNRSTVKALHCAVEEDLNEVIQRFWAVEEVPTLERKNKPIDEACERFFAETYVRDSDGRYNVRLPLTADPPQVEAETRKIALSSLKNLQQRFRNDPSVAHEYFEFMETYRKLGHMTRVSETEINNPRSWYLPHHAVITGTPPNRKIRVVFDASRQTREKYRLNDFLMSGPPLQKDLSLILLNWRRYRYAFTADIVKMLRQIRVAREDQDFQRILWSPSPAIPPTDYRLTTVTYGTACAPYLALRTLSQLAHDERERYPIGAACLEYNTYVDDTFAGANELATAINQRDELIAILKSAGFELDKWSANHSELLPSSTLSTDEKVVKSIDGDSVKALGVHWNPFSDSFRFSSVDFDFCTEKLTKRSIYSQIARLFDPLGWLAPITVVAKIIMQDLWIQKCEWDEPIPVEIREKWRLYCRSLSTLPLLTINRWLGLSENGSLELHGFCDSSSRAYAAVLYLRIDDGKGNFNVALLTAKTKIAPVKTISVPNLELCGLLFL